ncbi:MAG: High-affinity zinc uptake system membrane protein ZnuB [Paraeggerthella hongkongensis]|uniref:metal ABC transporter permease n=1 Tax=Paraeggerthella TaxID=651554 RepID=UPI001C122CD4|nr:MULTISPECIES: metal ABC transporter permease [Paraeggerthella]MBU5406037.1 metal ABC transporter permease [Paraeggerthella hongkongensis]MCD2433886.1 metal ABC transporter permease [Paraeggerthella hominis]MDY3981799.1 metal ABC transporter permease [Paraeggerthella sp.]
MFEYLFMQRAFVAGLILGIAVPCVGVVVVLKRLSMMGDALSHTALAGVAGGLIAGINPVLGATIACLGAAGAIEVIRRRFEGHAELAIAIVMSCGIGLAGVLSGFVPNAASFSSFLFGSIVTVNDDDLLAVAAVGATVLLLCALMRKELFLVTLDERAARLAGVRTKTVNAAFILITALCVSVAARTVGALIVSSMMVVPVACALQIARSWKQIVILSCGIGVTITAIGLTVSYELGLKPGGTIVLIGIGALALVLVAKHLRMRLRSTTRRSTR